MEIILPDFADSYAVVPENESADICFYSVQLDDETLLRPSELNIFISVENLGHYNHYKFYNKFGRVGSTLTNIYIQNDRTETVKTDTYIEIPMIHFRIQYFNKMAAQQTRMNIPFSNKRFCLFVSRNNNNTNKMKLLHALSQIGQVDHISKFNVLLEGTTCYNSPELLKVFNHYKFIVCFENSCSSGYITEKIFNVFLANSIPIYDGAPDIDNYIRPEAYIKYNDSVVDKVIHYMASETAYNTMIAEEKIQPNNNYDTSLLSDAIRQRMSVTNNTTLLPPDNCAVSQSP
jgi:hypothetical protein